MAVDETWRIDLERWLEPSLDGVIASGAARNVSVTLASGEVPLMVVHHNEAPMEPVEVALNALREKGPASHQF